MHVSRTHPTNSRVLPRSLPAPVIPSSQLDLAQWTLTPHYLTLKGKEGVFKIGRGVTKRSCFFFFPVRASRGSQSSLRLFSKILIFSESLIFFCLHESIMSLHLSSLRREHLPCKRGISPSLLPHFIAVGNYGLCGSLVKRAKICSQNESSGTAVAPAKHGQ